MKSNAQRMRDNLKQGEDMVAEARSHPEMPWTAEFIRRYEEIDGLSRQALANLERLERA